MKVKATKLGYYENKRRKEGSIFFIKDASHLSNVWMEVIDENKKAPSKKVGKVKEESKEVDSNSEVI